jgi:hypothetical protein
MFKTFAVGLVILVLVVVLVLWTISEFADQYYGYDEEGPEYQVSNFSNWLKPKAGARSSFRVETVWKAKEILVAFIIAAPALLASFRARFSKRK